MLARRRSPRSEASSSCCSTTTRSSRTAGLQQLIGLVNLSPALGMVGPMTNYAAPPQLVETIPYRLGARKGEERGSQKADTAAMHRFASELREQNKAKWMQTDRLGGFCLLMKREVLRRLTNQGGLDKWTDLGLFDTDNLEHQGPRGGIYARGVPRLVHPPLRDADIRPRGTGGDRSSAHKRRLNSSDFRSHSDDVVPGRATAIRPKPRRRCSPGRTFSLRSCPRAHAGSMTTLIRCAASFESFR